MFHKRVGGKGREYVRLIKGLCLHHFQPWFDVSGPGNGCDHLSLSLTLMQQNWGSSVCVESSSISFTSIRLLRGSDRLNLYFGRSFTGPDSFFLLYFPSSFFLSFLPVTPHFIWCIVSYLQFNSQLPCQHSNSFQKETEIESSHWKFQFEILSRGTVATVSWIDIVMNYICEKRKEDEGKWIEVGMDQMNIK